MRKPSDKLAVDGGTSLGFYRTTLDSLQEAVSEYGDPYLVLVDPPAWRDLPTGTKQLHYLGPVRLIMDRMPDLDLSGFWMLYRCIEAEKQSALRTRTDANLPRQTK